MHSLENLMNVLRANPEKEAVIWQARAYRYAWLYDAVSRWGVFLEKQGVKPGSVVSVEADFSPNAIGLLLALIRRSCIVVPLTASVEVKKSEFRDIAQVETVIGLADGEISQIRRTGARVEHELRNLAVGDRKSTRLNSSHITISYAVFCLKKKKTTYNINKTKQHITKY